MESLIVVLVLGALVGGVAWNWHNKKAAFAGVSFAVAGSTDEVVNLIESLYCIGIAAKARSTVTGVQIARSGQHSFRMATRLGDEGGILVQEAGQTGLQCRVTTEVTDLVIGSRRRVSDAASLWGLSTRLDNAIKLAFRIAPNAARLKRFQWRLQRNVLRQMSSPASFRAEVDLLVEFGRHQLLRSGSVDGHEGPGPSEWFDRLSVWVRPLIAGPPVADQAIHELNEIAMEYGGWAAVGAWKVMSEFAGTDQAVADGGPALTACVRAYDAFGITNLALHVPMAEAEAYSRVLGRPPPMDGFFGPPVFTTSEGPQKSHYLDAAAAAAARREPVRLTHAPGVPPQALDDLAGDALWDFARLLVMGPALVTPERRHESAILARYRTVADGADHAQVLEGLRAKVEATRDPNWLALGAARFVEEYLDSSLTCSDGHLALLDRGLDFLRSYRWLEGNCSPGCLSKAELQRLSEQGVHP